jgi:NTE family protein
MQTSQNKIGLSLSGGGYRAAAFHLGTLKKLNELNILSEVDVISTISGGSIAGAYYCLKKDSFKTFEEELYTGLQKNDVLKIIFKSWIFLRTILFALLFIVPAIWLLFTPYPWLFPIVMLIFFVLLIKFQFYIFPVSKVIAKAYDKFYYKNATLGNLPSSPVLVIGSTNLQTARPFSFSKIWMQDSTYQYLKDDKGQVVPVEFSSAHYPLPLACPWLLRR